MEMNFNVLARGKNKVVLATQKKDSYLFATV